MTRDEMTNIVTAMVSEFADHIAGVVLKRMEDNTSNMMDTLNVKIKVDRILGFEDAVKELINDTIEGVEDRLVDKARDEAREVAEDAAQDALKNATFEVDVSF